MTKTEAKSLSENKEHNFNNFTIITSGGCNCKCDFCTDPMNYKKDPLYLANLAKLLLVDGLPDGFDTLSISGGEPTISPDLESIFGLVKNAKKPFKKVIFTTNGTRLLGLTDLIGENCDHVNVSRHGIGYEDNVKVFKNKQIINDGDLTLACERLNEYGVDVNLNHVYRDEDKLTKEYVYNYIDYAKSVGATKVTFRYDQNYNSLEPTYLEALFPFSRLVEEGGCPVCRSHTILVKGMYVTFKSSYQEPTKELGGDLYELIYHPSGKLTQDWEGKVEYKKATPPKLPDVPVRLTIPTKSTGGYGSGGCGHSRFGSGGC